MGKEDAQRNEWLEIIRAKPNYRRPRYTGPLTCADRSLLSAPKPHMVPALEMVEIHEGMDEERSYNLCPQCFHRGPPPGGFFWYVPSIDEFVYHDGEKRGDGEWQEDWKP
jgi:hypothetical protein